MNDSATLKDTANIIIVDDNADNLRLLESILIKKSYVVRQFINPVKALESANVMLPDMFLLDIDMPELTGYELCDALKLIPNAKNIPVIFLSCFDGSVDKVKAFDHGAVDYITKPFHAHELLSRVDTHLSSFFYQQEINEKNLLLERYVVEMDAARKQLIQSERTAAVYQFIYHIAHNLNTPLGNAVTAATLNHDYFKELSVLLNAPSPTRKGMQEQVGRMVKANKIVTKSLSRATSLINKLQSLTTISTAELTLCNIKLLIESYINKNKLLLLESNIEIEIEIASNINCQIPRNSISELLDIFIENTIKHVNKPAITVYISAHYEEQLKLTYQDNGTSPDFTDFAFDALYNDNFSLNSQLLEQGIGLVKAHFISVKQGIELSLGVGEFGGVLYSLEFPVTNCQLT